MPGRLPDPRAAHEAERRREVTVDAVKRDEVVEQVVGVVGGDPPGERRAGDARRLAAGDPHLGLEVRAVDDEREVQVQPTRPPGYFAIWSGPERRDGADVGAVEQVVLDRG